MIEFPPSGGPVLNIRFHLMNEITRNNTIKVMKKILSTLLSIFLLGIMGMSATVYTHTIGKSDFHDGKSQQTANMTGVNWTLNMQNSTYIGTGSITSKGIQLGKSKQAFSTATLTTSEIPGTIKGITINTSGASKIDATVSVKVNGVSLGTEQKITSSAADYTFTGAQSGTIEILWTNNSYNPSNGQGKAIYLKSITVEYEESASSNKVATPEVTPVSGTYNYGTEVTITCATPGAKISYILNLGGGVVTKNDYTAPFQLTRDCSLSVTAEKEGMTPSETVNVTYTVKVPAKYGFKKNITSYKRYILVADYNEVAKALTADKTYGYLYSEKNDPVEGYISLSDNAWAFQITTDETGVGQISDSENRFYYMTDQYDSFQVNPKNATPVDADFRWKYEPQADGTVKITHIATGKWIQYNNEKHQFGAYNTEIGTLPKLYEEGATADTPIVESVVFNPAGGVIDRGSQVTITCATPDVTIKYAVKLAVGGDGTPKIYEGPITVDENCTISAYAEKAGMENCPTIFAEYTVKSANPLQATFNFTNPETLNPGVNRNDILPQVGYNITEPFINNGIQVKFTNGTTPTRFWDSTTPHVRLYQNGSIEISCIEKEISIEKITITGNTYTSETYLTPNVGTYTNGTWGIEWDPTLPEKEKHIFTVTFAKTGKTAEIESIDVLKKVATGVEDSKISVVSIIGTEDGVEIAGVEGNVEVYNVYGQQVANEYVNGNATIATPAGIMIVKAGETIAKVLVK